MPSQESGTDRPVTRKFKAEVSQVLDIVIHSLYTHRDIFVRELVSNAADALEKMRHESVTAGEYTNPDAPFEIRIDTDPEAHTVTITDTGIGMTFDDLNQNLGTIARSGTLEFAKRLAGDEESRNDLIGRFGVGFYSAFMVADKITVSTRSHLPGEPAHEWSSAGAGEYRIALIEDRPRGTSVTVHLRENAHEFETADRIKEIIRKYSSFVPFPILVDGERVNTVQAIWLKSPAEVTDDAYAEFFKFIAATEDEPLFRLHLTADAPIQLASILFVPKTNLEQYGFFKLKPSVNLYSKKILLQQHTEHLLPEYLRFVQGVVDSADLSLNISRETIQNDAVFRKLGKFLTKRFIKFLGDEASKHPDKYTEFWGTFGTFIKEGAVSDHEHRADLAKLLRFASSMTEGDELVSLEQYKGRMREEQKAIYYLTGASRESIERGPYLATFAKRSIEVLYLHESIDDFVMANLGEYDGVKLVSADSADLDLPEGGAEPPASELTVKQVGKLTAWIKDTLGDRVREVRESKRILDRPAIIVNPDAGMTTGMHRVMRLAGRDTFGMPPQVLEINTSHPLIAAIQKLRDGTGDKGFLQTCVAQMYDNALAEAGLLENPGDMVARVYGIMERALADEAAKE